MLVVGFLARLFLCLSYQSWCGILIPCRRACFQLFFRRICSVCSYRVGVSVVGDEFWIYLFCHLGLQTFSAGQSHCFLNDFFWAPVLFCVCVFFFKSVIFNLSPKIHKNISSDYFISCLNNKRFFATKVPKCYSQFL